MHLELVKTDFLTLDGKINSFTLTPKKEQKGIRKVRGDRIIDFVNTSEFEKQVLGGNIVYNFHDCDLEVTVSPPNRNFNSNSEENSFSFEYNHMHIPLGAIGSGHVGRWNLILPPNWRLTELYISDPYDQMEKVEEKRQFGYSVHWDNINKVQLIEMELRSKRGSFSFIVKGKAHIFFNETDNGSVEFISSTESEVGINDLDSLKVSFSKESIFQKIYKYLEMKPQKYGVSFDLKEFINDYLNNKNYKK